MAETASSLVTTLQGYRYTALLQIARFNDIAVEDAQGRALDKPGLIRVLVEELFTPKRVSAALKQIGHLERAVLHRALQKSARMDTQEFRTQLQEQGIVPPGSPSRWDRAYGGDPYDPAAHSFEDVMARLTLHGLLLSTGIPDSWGQQKMLDLTPGSTLLVPPVVRHSVPEPKFVDVEWGRGSLPAPVQDTDIAVSQRDLFIYWSAALLQPLPLTQAGMVRKRTLRRLNNQLLVPDPALDDAQRESQAPRLYFLRLLLQDLGLLAQRNQHLEATDGPSRLPQFWEDSPLQRAVHALEAWKETEAWNELSGLGLATLDLDLFRARRRLVEQLAVLPVELWISSERFSDRLLLGTPSLLFEPHNLRPWAAVLQADNQYAGQYRQRLGDIQAAFVGRALSGPLHWLGIVDISLDDDRVLAFRINRQGAEVLGMAGDPERAQRDAPQAVGQPDDEGRVVVQPSFHILALGPVPESALAKLEAFADRLQADRSVFEYVLSRETVYRGQQWGFAVDDILAILHEMSSVPIPQNVRRSLREWETQYQRIAFHKGKALLHTSSDSQLEELWHNAAVRRHLARRLTPTVALVRPGHRAALENALFNRGILAARCRPDDACVDGVHAQPSGQLQRIKDGPNLPLERCLAQLAEVQNGRHVVTQGSVTRALQNGITLSEYLDRLARVHRGPLPAKLRARIKAWGHYYGKASLRQATWLELRDAATAQELLADPELADLLSPFPPNPHGSAVLVESDDLDTVRKLLAERGVDLS